MKKTLDGFLKVSQRMLSGRMGVKPLYGNKGRKNDTCIMSCSPLKKPSETIFSDVDMYFSQLRLMTSYYFGGWMFYLFHKRFTISLNTGDVFSATNEKLRSK